MKLTAAQTALVRRKAGTRASSSGSSDGESGELNLVPFLDIVMNVVMFLLASISTVFTASLAIRPGARDMFTEPRLGILN